MADFTSALQAFPPSSAANVSSQDFDRIARAHVKFLDLTSDSTWNKANGKLSVTELLDPAVHSLSYLYALHAECASAGKDLARTQECLDHVVIFFSTFDPIQVRYAGLAFRKLLEWTLDILSRSDLTDISPVVVAMLRLDPSGSTFTSTHLHVLRLCLGAGVPSQALPLLDCDIYAFPHKTSKHLSDVILSEEQELSSTFITAESGFSVAVRPEMVLEYYLLGAHVYIGRRNYDRARLFLEHILLVPSPYHSTSALQVEAYKKWIVVGLLAGGKRYPLPRTHDQQVIKNVQASSRPYEALAQDFEKRDWRKFQAEMDEGQEIWREDGNARLVKEAADALVRFRIADLQKTYAAVPVSRVAAHLGSASADEALQLLTAVITAGQLSASITPAASGAHADAVLRFHAAAPTAASLAEAEAGLAAQTLRIRRLATFLRDTDRRLQLSGEYVDHLRRQKRSAAGPEGDLADQMDLTWDAPIAPMGDEGGDEDLMAS